MDPGDSCIGNGGSSITGAIAGGVAAGAALIFAVPALGFAWWRRRKPQENFFDVPGTDSFLIIKYALCYTYKL